MYRKFCEACGYPLARGDVCPRCCKVHYEKNTTQESNPRHGGLLREGEEKTVTQKLDQDTNTEGGQNGTVNHSSERPSQQDLSLLWYR